MPKLTKRTLTAVLWHALAYQSKKQAVRTDLADGSSTAVHLEVRGSIAGQTVGEVLVGRLTVGHESTVAASDAAPTVDVVAYLLEQLPDTRRRLELAKLPRLYGEAGGMPAVSPEVRGQAEALLKQLRTQKSATRAGAVRFEPAPVALGDAA